MMRTRVYLGYPRFFLFLFLSLSFLAFNSKELFLLTADLPRHLMNGKMIFEGNWSVLSENFYSYTHPSFPFMNHHWASGVIFYGINQVFGFLGLSVFYRFMGLATFLMFFFIAEQLSNLRSAFFASLLVLPILAFRSEVRPEGFSALLLGVFFLILYQWRVGLHKPGDVRSSLGPPLPGFWSRIYQNKILFLLPVLMMVWVNLHIYFFTGFVVLAAFFLEISWSRMKSSNHSLHGLTKNQLREAQIQLIQVTFFCFLATFINPLTYRVALFPFFIFNNYGYELLENQTPFFFLRREDSLIPQLNSYFFLVSLIVGAWAYRLLFLKNYRYPFLFFMGIFGVLLSFQAVRNFEVFALIAVPFLAVGWEIGPGFKTRALVARGGAFQLAAVLLSWAFYWGSDSAHRGIGFNPVEGVEKAAEFFIKNQVKGPILNNYDNGGYLIYYLFPGERVFVDNRPEAYPASFFKEIYVPLLGSEDYWIKESPRYNFNALFFTLSDLTPWAQSFLKRRTHDPDWRIVYLDNYSIILVKNSPQNQNLIRQWEKFI